MHINAGLMRRKKTAGQAKFTSAFKRALNQRSDVAVVDQKESRFKRILEGLNLPTFTPDSGLFLTSPQSG